MNTPANRKSITDSPWYWAYLFCTAGAIALVLAGPKFTARQSQIERKYEARQVAARHVSSETGLTEPLVVEQSTDTRVTLWPLYCLLGVVFAIAWVQLWRNHKRNSAQVNSEQDKNEVALNEPTQEGLTT